MQAVAPRRLFLWLEFGLLAVIAGFSALFIVKTIHWPLVGDAGLTHYMIFLIDHGRAPYRDIVDFNLPGSYLIEWGAMHLFGGGALAWRLFDLSLFAVIAIAMTSIAVPYGWASGLFAALLFLLVHGRDGVEQAGERDLMLAALLVTACALLFSALRKNTRWQFPIFGFCVGIGSLIKPQTSVWGIAVWILTVAALRKTGRWSTLAGLSTLAGYFSALLIAFEWLVQEGSLRAFWQVGTGFAPYYSSIERFPVAYLILRSIPSSLFPLALLWVVLAFANKRWQTYEGRVLLISILFGVASFVFQGKNHPYHRYPLEVFLLLLIGIDSYIALRRKERMVRVLGAATLAYGALIIAPTALAKASHYDQSIGELSIHLESDLNRLGGARLSGHVQCMDNTSGCIRTLYYTKMMQSTRFLYDCYMLRPAQTPFTLEMRKEFMAATLSNPPEIFVVTNQLCLRGPNDYRKLDNWPEFKLYLDANYSVNEEWLPKQQTAWAAHVGDPLGYRIYVRHGSTSAEKSAVKSSTDSPGS